MDARLSRQFVEGHGMSLEMVPFRWNLRSDGRYFALCIRMSRLKELRFGFEFGSEPRDHWPITGHPERVLRFDVSLNELESLGEEALSPFENLRELNASLNSLKSVEGLVRLPHLLVLNLSYNSFSTVRDLKPCPSLTTLDISFNRLRSIRALSALGNLTQLHIGHNKLNSLEGIQNLAQLQELYAQSNLVTDLIPLSSCLHLQLLDLSHNQLSCLSRTVEVLSALRSLRQLQLKGNPITEDERYITMIAQRTFVEVLDSVLLKRAWKPRLGMRLLEGVGAAGQTKQDLEKAAQRAYWDRLQNSRQETGRAIQYLHGRIGDLQEDLKEKENSLALELQACLRYLDTVPPEDSSAVDTRAFPTAMDQCRFSKFWERWDRGRKRPGPIQVTDPTKPEEVVQTVVKLLENYLLHPPPSDDSCLHK
ncbi:hypothetical protein AAFF_G00167700 [Aldrovandia affinis]|uniref:Uncharacterized protein n=1 Tax=Aldrovandia affinis TaxID=143900 RepID=A0AAD7W8D1_9TELE|nr:hypothetical protein AAFF_G00167700 [Aldrovandia affinis]